jgi:hypothetical protein
MTRCLLLLRQLRSCLSGGCLLWQEDGSVVYPQRSSSSRRYLYITDCNLALWTSTQALPNYRSLLLHRQLVRAPPSGKSIKMRAFDTVAWVTATLTLRDTAPLSSRGQYRSESTQPALIWPASSCNSFAGQPIRISDFTSTTAAGRSRLCQWSTALIRPARRVSSFTGRP